MKTEQPIFNININIFSNRRKAYDPDNNQLAEVRPDLMLQSVAQPDLRKAYAIHFYHQ